MGQHPQTVRQLAHRLGLLQRLDQPGQGTEVNPAPGPGGVPSALEGKCFSASGIQ